MIIPYTYKVVSTDVPAKCMVVEYSAAGYETLRVGVPLPITGGSATDIIKIYAPTAQWRDSTLVYQDVPVGLEGLVPQVETSLDIAKAVKLAELADWRFALETSMVTVDGIKISTSRQSQAQLAAAYANLKDSLISSVEWKQVDGSFATIDTAQMGRIVAAVALHIQASFSAEKVYSEQIKACTTVAEVEAIALP